MTNKSIKKLDKYFPYEYFCESVKKYPDAREFAREFHTNLKLPEKRNEFSKLMNSKLQGESLIFLLDILMYLAMYEDEFIKLGLISYIICDKFYDSLVNLIREFLTNEDLKKKWEYSITVIIKFFESVVFYLPPTEYEYQKMYAVTEMLVDCIKLIDPTKTQPFLIKRIEEILDLIDDMIYFDENPDELDKEIYPYPAVLHKKIEIKPNQISGAYEDTNSYKDIHFKLLRENFFEEIRTDLKHFKLERVFINVRNNYSLYKSVISKTTCNPSCKKFKVCHLIKFSPEDETHLRNLNWYNCKKFMIGSILFFSQNNFTTYVMGIVEVNMCEITLGKVISIHVSLVGNPRGLEIGECYDMLEPSSFYAPYHYALKNLKTISPYLFPLSDDIVNVSKEVFVHELTQKGELYKGSDLNESQMNALNACLRQKFTLVQGPPGTGKSYLTRKLVTILSKDPNDTRPILVMSMRNRSLDIILEPLAQAGLNVLRFGRTDSAILDECTFYNRVKKMRHWKRSNLKGEGINIMQNQYRQLCTKLKKSNINQNKETEEALHRGIDYSGEALRVSFDNFYGSLILSDKVQVVGATTTGAAKRINMFGRMKPKAVIVEEAAEILEAFITTALPHTCDHLILIGDHKQLRPQTVLPDKFNLHISLFERMIQNKKPFFTLNVQHRMRPEIAQLVSPLIYENLINHESVSQYPDVKGIIKNVFFLRHSFSEQYTAETISYTNPQEAEWILSFARYLRKQGYSPFEITILSAYSAQQNHMIRMARKHSLLSDIAIQTIDNYQGEENTIILLSLVRSNGKTIGFLKSKNRVNVALSRAKVGFFMFGNISTLANHGPIWADIRKILIKQSLIGKKLPLKCATHGTITYANEAGELDKLTYGGCPSLCGLVLDCGHTCELKCHPDLTLHQTNNCLQPCLRRSCPYNHICPKQCYQDCAPCEETVVLALSCGHTNSMKCFERDTFVCPQPCKKRMPCNLHSCERSCHEGECGICEQIIPLQSNCGHMNSPKCSELSTFKCTAMCKKKMPCIFGHVCEKSCHEGECGICEQIVHIKLNCGHSHSMKCNEQSTFKCTAKCNKKKPCPCSHICEEKCHEGECPMPCETVGPFRFPCGHTHTLKCSDLSSFKCTTPCSKRSTCRYSHLCGRECHEGECPPCGKMITHMFKCYHSILLRCSELPLEVKCTDPCNKRLMCGHWCQDTCHLGSACKCRQMVNKVCPGCSQFIGSCSDYNSHLCKVICKNRCGNYVYIKVGENRHVSCKECKKKGCIIL